MAEILGFTSIALACLMTIYLSSLWPGISKILFTALILRVLFLLIGTYLFDLPDSTADAASFERKAWSLSQNSFFILLTDKYPGPDPRFISWLIAIPYSLLGRSLLMAKSMSLFCGMGCVFFGFKLANKLWDYQTAKKVGWVIALFPSLILYSVLTMREGYIAFFIIVALYGITTWVKTGTIGSIILTILGFAGASFFHGASAVGGIMFMIIIGLISLKKFYKSLANYRINIISFLFIAIITITVTAYLSNKIDIPYLGDYEDITSKNIIIEKASGSVMGRAAYPEWLSITSTSEFIYKSPIRSIYFIS